MHFRQRILIDLAVQILSQAVDASSKSKVDTIPVRLALRVLLPHCPERWPLVAFWNASSGNQDLGRGQSTTAAFNGIVRQLRLSGAWGEQTPD